MQLQRRILTELKKLKVSHVPLILGYGDYLGKRAIIVELLGPNLYVPLGGNDVNRYS